MGVYKGLNSMKMYDMRARERMMRSDDGAVGQDFLRLGRA